MKKRMLAYLLMVCILVTMLPTTTLAAKDVVPPDNLSQTIGDNIDHSSINDGKPEAPTSDNVAPNAGQSAPPSDNSAPIAGSTTVVEDIKIAIDGITYTIDFYNNGTFFL